MMHTLYDLLRDSKTATATTLMLSKDVSEGRKKKTTNNSKQYIYTNDERSTKCDTKQVPCGALLKGRQFDLIK